MIHRSASVSSSGSHARSRACRRAAAVGPSRFVRMKRPAFHSLLAKFRPGANEVSRSLGSRMTSVPTDMPEITRVAQCIRAEAAHHLERVDPVAAATWTSCGAGCRAPCRGGTRCVNGMSPMNSQPAITMRATQKKRISGRGHQDVCRDRTASRSVGLVGPAETGEGHEPGGEPGVEHVLVLAQRRRRRRTRLGHVGAAHDHLAARVAVPDRNPVAPPELPGDAPVADVLHPLGDTRRRAAPG